MEKYGFLLHYPLREWRSMALLLILTIANSMIVGLQPWPMKILVDYAIGDTALPTQLPSLLKYISVVPTPFTLVILAAISSLGFYLLNMTIDFSLTWFWSATSQRMVYDLANSLFYRLQRLSLLFHYRRTVGDSLSRLTEDVYCVHHLTEALFVAPSKSLLTLISIGILAYKLDPWLTLISFAVAPVMGWSALMFGDRLKRRHQQNREADSVLLSFVHQTFTAMEIVQVFGTEESNRKYFKRLTHKLLNLRKSHILLKSSSEFVNGLIEIVCTAFILGYGSRQVLLNSITVGSLLIFLAYLKSMQIAFKSLLIAYGNFKAKEGSAERVREILQAKNDLPEIAKPLVLPISTTKTGKSICFQEVTFGYEPDSPILEDFNLEVSAGETIAIVGATGSGKSTLVSLIPRFFDPWQGKVLFDGINLRQIRLDSLRSQVAIVLQESFLLPLTIAQNIAYGSFQASRQEIIAAAVAANADGFIRSLPEGYDTIIEERGANLSGGQKQRIAIARAFLKDAPVLILDEPTSALDLHTESLLIEAIERLMMGKTTFIIAHRLSTIRQCDRIIVLDRGKIVEAGTHPELLAANSYYHHLYSLQFAHSDQEKT